MKNCSWNLVHDPVQGPVFELGPESGIGSRSVYLRVGLLLYHRARHGAHDPVSHGSEEGSLERLGHDVCYHEFGGAVYQSDDPLDDEVMNPEVPDPYVP